MIRRKNKRPRRLAAEKCHAFKNLMVSCRKTRCGSNTETGRPIQWSRAANQNWADKALWDSLGFKSAVVPIWFLRLITPNSLHIWLVKIRGAFRTPFFQMGDETSHNSSDCKIIKIENLPHGSHPRIALLHLLSNFTSGQSLIPKAW